MGMGDRVFRGIKGRGIKVIGGRPVKRDWIIGGMGTTETKQCRNNGQ